VYEPQAEPKSPVKVKLVTTESNAPWTLQTGGLLHGYMWIDSIAVGTNTSKKIAVRQAIYMFLQDDAFYWNLAGFLTLMVAYVFIYNIVLCTQ
jgi:hypothetical protein